MSWNFNQKGKSTAYVYTLPVRMLPICGVGQNGDWVRDAPDACNITCIAVFFFVLLVPSLHLPRGRMLLDLWEGLNTKCLAMASPTKVTKVQEVQYSLIPLRKRAKSTEVKHSGGLERVKPWGLVKERPFFSLQLVRIPTHPKAVKRI